jgi:Flp pilus assembly pilin Flp
MKALLRFFNRFEGLWKGEEGQDLVEYSLVVTLIAFGSVVAMQSLDIAIGQTFNAISTTLAGALGQ